MPENLLINTKNDFQRVVKKLKRENNGPAIKEGKIILDLASEEMLIAKHRIEDNFRKSSLERALRNRKNIKQTKRSTNEKKEKTNFQR